MKNKLYITVLLMIGACTIYAGNLMASDAEKFLKLSAYDIFGLLERAKIAAFSTDSFKRSGADQNSVTAWNGLTDSLNQFALANAAPANKPILEKYIKDLTDARMYIENTIQALKGGTVGPSTAQAQRYAMNMGIIENEALEKIKSVTQPTDQWINQIPQGNVVLNPVNLKTFTDYTKILDQATQTGKPIQDFEIAGILKLNSLTTNKQVGDLINNLEQYNYKMRDSRAKQFLSDLARVYPKILSTYMLSIISNTKNKPYMIIFTQAGAYSNILQQIIRELGQK